MALAIYLLIRYGKPGRADDLTFHPQLRKERPTTKPPLCPPDDAGPVDADRQQKDRAVGPELRQDRRRRSRQDQDVQARGEHREP